MTHLKLNYKSVCSIKLVNNAADFLHINNDNISVIN